MLLVNSTSSLINAIEGAKILHRKYCRDEPFYIYQRFATEPDALSWTLTPDKPKDRAYVAVNSDWSCNLFSG